MPTIRSFSNYKICMYADDHNPPHFHILSPDFEVQVAIATLEVIRGRALAKDIGEALQWAERHKADLSLKWIQLNASTW